jgi:hypothetical protein
MMPLIVIAAASIFFTLLFIALIIIDLNDH